VGQSRVIVANYQVLDAQGATVDQSATITITGTNDTPRITVGIDDADTALLDETNDTLSIFGTLTLRDLDADDTVTVSVVGVEVGGISGSLTSAQALSMLSLSNQTANAANADALGNLNWHFDSDAQAFNFLAFGEQLTLTYALVATDSSTARTNAGDEPKISNATVVITITGTNDAPVLSAITAPDAVVELTDASAQNIAAITGVLSVSDLDVGKYAHGLDCGQPDGLA